MSTGPQEVVSVQGIEWIWLKIGIIGESYIHIFIAHNALMRIMHNK
jgi:hypothetical protein